MKIARRSFLKYLGGLAASAVVIPYFLKPKKTETVQAIASDYLTDDTAWFLTEHDAREFIVSQSIFNGKACVKGKMIYGSVKNI